MKQRDEFLQNIIIYSSILFVLGLAAACCIVDFIRWAKKQRKHDLYNDNSKNISEIHLFNPFSRISNIERSKIICPGDNNSKTDVQADEDCSNLNLHGISISNTQFLENLHRKFEYSPDFDDLNEFSLPPLHNQSENRDTFQNTNYTTQFSGTQSSNSMRPQSPISTRQSTNFSKAKTNFKAFKSGNISQSMRRHNNESYEFAVNKDAIKDRPSITDLQTSV